MTVKHTIYRIFIITLFTFIFSEGMAGTVPKSEAEFARLPAYCKARLGAKSGLKVAESEVRKWKQALGPGFLQVHHFCNGLNTLYSYKLNYRVPNISALNGVLGEFEYTQKHASEDFPLQPKISVEKGRVLLRLNRASEAISEFRRAIQLNPAYSPPYAELSDYFVKRGIIDEAVKVLNEGLKYSPNSKSLKRRLAKLQ